MNRSLCLLALLVSSIVAPAVRAQGPLGTVAATFPYHISKVLADPVRPRVYAADVEDNVLIVIDTVTLGIIDFIPTGSNPADMAISLDGATLYVANSGSTLEAIDLIDLGSLTEYTSFSLPTAPAAIAAGLDGRLYVGSTSSPPGPIYQVDGITGEVQDTIHTSLYDTGFLQISPDGNTLFATESEVEPGSITSYDVSTDTAVLLQTNSQAGENTEQLVVSHDGNYLCMVCGGGNDAASSSYTTLLFSTADITAYYGGFATGAYPGPLAFSPDDNLVYQSVDNSNELKVFDTQTFQQLGEVSLPALGDQGYPPDVNSIIADNTGSYLFVSQNSSGFDSSGNFGTIGQLVVIATGGGTGLPTPLLPTVNIAATLPSVLAGSGHHASFTITRADGDFSRPLTVFYSIRGTAQNGTDYTALTGRKTILPNQASAVIQVVPADIQGPQPRTVLLTLQPHPTYQRGGSPQATVRIRPDF